MDPLREACVDTPGEAVAAARKSSRRPYMAPVVESEAAQLLTLFASGCGTLCQPDNGADCGGTSASDPIC